MTFLVWLISDTCFLSWFQTPQVQQMPEPETQNVEPREDGALEQREAGDLEQQEAGETTEQQTVRQILEKLGSGLHETELWSLCAQCVLALHTAGTQTLREYHARRLSIYYYYIAFILRHVSHQFGNAKAHINEHTHVKSITKKSIKSP